MKLIETARTLFCICTTIFLVSACGGGGVAEGTSAAVLADAQGRWRGQLSLTDRVQNASVLVLPDGQAWMLYTTLNNGVRLLQGGLSVSGQQLAGQAKLFELESGNALSDVTLTARAVASSSLSINSNEPREIGNFASTTFVSQNTPAVSINGVWRDVPDSPSVQWTIDNNGTLSGFGTGCTVNGTVLARLDSASVADVHFQEDCGGVLTSWSGVGLNGASLDSLRLTLVKSDRSKAFVLELNK